MDVSTFFSELWSDLQQNQGGTFLVIQVFLVVLASLSLDFIQKRLAGKFSGRVEVTKQLWDDALLFALPKPLSLLIWIVGISFAAQILAGHTGAAIFNAIEPIRAVGVIAVICWFMFRFILAMEHNIITRAELRGESVDITTVDAIAKLLRVSVIITAILVALQTLGFSISGVLAFGGIGGIAIGFAAKDILANFFGGLMIYLDRPFVVGDWIRSPDRDIEGTVTKIGWRLTCIRTFDKRPLYVPNSVFANISVQNPSRMSHRRINETIGVRYDDAGKLPEIVAAVKNMLETHPDIDQSQTLMVNFNTFSPSSLDFFIYTFTRTTNWVEFHQVKQNVLFQINKIIEQHGAEIAFPTSTIHIPDGATLKE
ncbi:MAG: mechanosensitive ion channel family protein [Gammaproteobacteria bacterium]|nr:mechanosensitive ion channel family protein [Gammaproteobacteria bacterium]